MVRIRKIPGFDITWRAFICSNDDLDPANFNANSLLDFLRNHPVAVPQYTLDKDTTQSSIDFKLDFLLSLGTSVTYVLPPLRTPRIVIFAESSAALTDKELCVAVYGNISIGGFGYVGGKVSPA